MNLNDLPEILKTDDMCGYFRCSRPTLRKRWQEGELPKPIKQGGEYIWPRWTIEEHLGKKPVEQPPALSISPEVEDRMVERVLHRLLAGAIGGAR